MAELEGRARGGFFVDHRDDIAYYTDWQGTIRSLAAGAGGTITVRRNSGANVGTQPRLNFIEGSNVTLTVANDPGNSEIDITIDAAGASGLADPGGNGVVVRTALNTTTNRSIAVGGTAGLTINNADGTGGNPTINLGASLDSNARVTVRRNTGADVGTRRRLNFVEGANVTLTIADDPGNEEVDITIASSGGGGGGLGDPGGNGVVVRTALNTTINRTIQATGAGVSVNDGDGVAGDPTIDLDDLLDAIAGLGANGIIVRTGASGAAARTISSTSAALVVTDGNGVAGNPSLALDADLDALAALSGTGYAVRTAANTWAQRTIVGGTAITVTNGDGVSGNTSIAVTAGAITFTQIQNIATDRLLGRDTAGSGAVEELTVGGGLEFTGSGGIQRSALTGDVTANAGNNATTIPNDTVTYAKMQNVSAADRLLGRGNGGGSGDVQEISLGTNLSMSGTTLNASGGGGAGAWTLAAKAADTSRTNNTLLADPDLVFAMSANTTYTFRGVVFVNTASVPDFKWRHSGPASPTLVVLMRYQNANGTTTWTSINLDTAYSAADILISVTGAIENAIFFDGIVQNGANSGNWEFQWAQNATNATPAIVRGGSYIQYAAV